MTPGAADGPYDAAYQGQPGAYSEEAAWALVGEGARLLPCETLAMLFDALVSGRAARAVVPVENSLAGTVPRAYELLLEHEVSAVAETCVRIDHVLIAAPGTRLPGVRRVLSHPVALDQCTRFIAARGVEAVPVFDTAGAVSLVMADAARDVAAIASRRAAALHRAAIIAERIQDDDENWTRFLLLARNPVAGQEQGRKAIVAFRLRHEQGTLGRALECLASQGLNLTKIESRPIRGRPFEYAFVIEAVRGEQSLAGTAWLEAFRRVAIEVRLIGCY
jgi:prephenate dehydratase